MAGPAEPRPWEPITLEIRRDGTPRYRAVVDIGTSYNRKQQKRRFATLREARDWVAEVRTDSRRGTHIGPAATTFDQMAESYLRLAANRVREVTVNGYKQSLHYAKQAFGGHAVQDITRDDVLALVEDMAKRGLSARTVSGMLVHTRAVFELAMEDRIVSSNPARKIKPRGNAPTGRTAHTEAERAALKIAAADEWLSACWLLSLAGMRRSEVLGLRWSDVDLDSKIVTVTRGRVLIDTKNVAEGQPKSRNSTRRLAIPDSYVTALKAMQARHADKLGQEHLANGYLAITEIGEPMRPRLYSEHWKRLCRKAKVRELTLHEARHSSVSLMRSKGISDQVIAAFHGHDEQTMRRTYSHLMPGDLETVADVL